MDKALEMNICMASDDNYAKHLGVVIASILKNSTEKENFIFHIIDGGISENNKNKILELKKIRDFKIQYYIPDIDKYNKWFDKAPQKIYFSPATFYRLSIPEIFYNIDKILYLDSDIIVNLNIKEFFDIDIENYYALVKVEHFKNKGSYFNAGIMMINNKLWIKDNLLSKFEEYFSKYYFRYLLPDQDLLNEVLEGNVKDVGNKYNYGPYDKKIDGKDSNSIDKIIHYSTSQKTWLPTSCNRNSLFIEEYWKYFCLTPWFQEEPSKYIEIMIKQQINEIINRIIPKLEYKKYNIADFILSVLEDNNYLSLTILGIKISIKKKQLIQSNIYEKFSDRIFSIYQNSVYKRLTVLGFKIIFKHRVEQIKILLEQIYSNNAIDNKL